MSWTPEGAGGSADSAGVPWAGREVKASPFAGDRGDPDERLLAALKQVAEDGALDDSAHRAVIDAMRAARLFVPIVAAEGEDSAEMAMVTVAAEDGRATVPAFTCVASLAAWNAAARPIPVQTDRLALATVEEGSQLVILDAGSPHRFLVRRPAVWALAQGLPWAPAWSNPAVGAAVERAADAVPEIVDIDLAPGSSRPNVGGPEIRLALSVRPGLDSERVAAVLERFQRSLGAASAVADHVDSLGIAVRAAS